jgi:hypothetical protein
MRNHYWTCSKFADWLRGTASPKAETSDGWRIWRKKAQAAHPIRYWLADDGLDYLQTIFYWPTDRLYAIKYYINNRFVTRTHQLTAHARDIAPGSWCDVGNRFLPCLFNELRDFVEVELAWWHIAWEKPEVKKKYQAPFWATGWFRWRTWRCPQAGLDNLAWQMSLTNDFLTEDHPDYGGPSRQAEAAREIQELYHWWTVIRPARAEPMEVSGWSAYCDARRAADPEDWLTSDDKIDTGPMLDQMHDLEARYEQEDEDMMIRLIRIRQALWT